MVYSSRLMTMMIDQTSALPLWAGRRTPQGVRSRKGGWLSGARLLWLRSLKLKGRCGTKGQKLTMLVWGVVRTAGGVLHSLPLPGSQARRGRSRTPEACQSPR